MRNSSPFQKEWLIGIGIVMFLVFLPGAYGWAYPIPAPVANDLWDVSQGITTGVTSGAHPASHIGYMFGKDFDGIHEVNGTGVALLRGVYQATVFSDNYLAGTPDENKHFVEWTTANPVTVGRFNLFGFSDAGGLSARSFDSFTLKAKLNSGDTWTPLYSTSITDSQYVTTNDADWGGNVYWLSLSVDVDTIMAAQYFRAEIHGANGGWGPRVVELDGFAAVPIPGAVWLLGSGLLGLGAQGWRRRKKS